MPRNSEGEFEMVLGNKELWSILFLVVILLAVVFSLGYMAGRNAASSASAPAQPAHPAPVAASPDERPSPTPSPSAAVPLARTPVEATEPAPGAEPARTEPVVRFEPEPPAPNSDAPAPASGSPPLALPGQIHLQLAAVRVKGDAEALAETLRKKGYDVHVNSQTRDGWHRVIAGPFASEAAAREMQARLEKDGFKSLLKKP